MEAQDDGRDTRPPDSVTTAAEAIADGRTPDWTGLESSSGSESERERALLSDLRVIASIASVHAAQAYESRLEADVTAETPTAWGPLVIRQEIGHGRFGDVYRAWDPRLDREVALKLLQRHERASADDTAVIEEGRLMARVRHPSVITIYGAERIDGRTGLWMELVNGRTLTEELAERGPLPADEIVAIGITLADALSAVHRAGLVHRDIKTSNVMRDSERGILLGDFGTGLELSEVSSGDGPRDLAGTPLYIAPEVLDGRAATPQSDIYSLGVLLFHLASGSFPVRGGSLRDVRRAHASGQRASLRDLAPDVPPALANVIERAIAPQASERFEDTDAMGHALDACRTPARPSPARWLWPAVAAAGLVVAVALWLAVTPRESASPPGADTWGLVGSFDNRTSDPLLDDTLEELLVRELRASTSLNVVSRERVNDALILMNRSPDTRLDGEVAREVALRDGRIRWIIAGQVSAADGGYELLTNVIAPADGAVLVSVTERATTREDLAASIGRMAVKLRRGLNESTASGATAGESLKKVTSSSLPAVQQYSQAARLWDQIPSNGPRSASLKAVEALLSGALELDPGFASAHILMAMALDQERDTTPQWSDVLAHASQAVSLARSLPVGERLFIEATSYRIQGDRPDIPDAARAALRQQAIDAYEELLDLEPDYAWAYRGLSRLYQDTNRPADQIRTLIRLGEVRPHGVAWRAEAARVAFRSGDLEAARTLASGVPESVPQAEMEARPIDVAWVELLPAHLAWLEDDMPRALAAADAFAARMPNVPVLVRWQFAGQLVNLYMTLGRLHQAEAAVDWLPEFPDDLRFQYRAMLAAERGADETLRTMLAAATWPQKALVPTQLLQAGLLDDWRRWRALEGPIPLQDGRLALAERRLDDAIEILTASRTTLVRNQLLVDQTLAQALRADGELARAIDTLERGAGVSRIQLASGWSHGWVWIKLRADLADLYREAGRIDEARMVEAHLRQLLSVADEDHPIKMRLNVSNSR